MKLFSALLVFSFSSQAFALPYFECLGRTVTGKVVAVSGCVEKVNDNTSDNYIMANCPGTNQSYLVIDRLTSVAKMTDDMIETVKIPGPLFKVSWWEDGFEIKLDENYGLGSMELSVVAGAPEDSYLKTNVSNFKHSFKKVSCTFK